MPTDQTPAHKISAVDLIAAERRRQIEAEGWDTRHDDEHVDGEMAKAAALYASEAWMPLTESHRNPPAGWPWEASAWKPTGDPVRDLVKAGALIAAEIDRLERERARQRRLGLLGAEPQR